MYILSFEDAERETSVLGPFSKLEKAQEYAEKDNNAPLNWGQADPGFFVQETWTTDDDPNGYYIIVKFEIDPEFVPPMEATYDDDDGVPDYWPPADESGFRPPPVFEPWRD